MSRTRALRLIETVRIHAPPDRVFRALTDPTELVAWWTIPDHYATVEALLDVRAGGRYQLSGTSVEHGPFTVTGVFRVVEAPHRLSFTWLPSWLDGMGESLVEIRLEPEGPTTLVTLTHTAVRSAASEQSDPDWPAVLGALRTHAEPPMYVTAMAAYLNHWFGDYSAAKRFQRSHGGFLLPYERQFFVTTAPALRELGLDPDDPDWDRIDHDWAAPGDRDAWERLWLRRWVAA